MEPIPEVEALRAKLQKNHCEHVRLETELALTFLQLGQVEEEGGDAEAAAASLGHARQAIEGARKGLSHIVSSEQRAALEQRITALENAMPSGRGHRP